MRRRLLIVALITVFASSAPVTAQDDPPRSGGAGIGGNVGNTPTGGGSSGPGFEAGTLWIEASTPESMTLVESPGRTNTGVVIRCGWYEIEFIDTPSVLTLVPLRPTEPGTYLLHCWYPIAGRPWDTTNAVPSDPPFPRPETWSQIIPDEIVASYEVAQYAYNSIFIEPPAPALSPATESIVGIETWLALNSELTYPAVTAQAGNVWATIQPVFTHVEWNLGNGTTLTCTDATTYWNPDGDPNQTSPCTYTYETHNNGQPFTGTATAHWDIHQQTNDPLDPPIWGTITRTTTINFNVRQLQAVIND